MPPPCRVTSAISGFPTTMVEALAGSLTSFAWSTKTAIRSGSGAARLPAGHNRMAVARESNPKRARARIRWDLNDILYSGALRAGKSDTQRNRRPTGVNLKTINERSAKKTQIGSRNPPLLLFAERIDQLGDDFAGKRGLVV